MPREELPDIQLTGVEYSLQSATTMYPFGLSSLVTVLSSCLLQVMLLCTLHSSAKLRKSLLDLKVAVLFDVKDKIGSTQLKLSTVFFDEDLRQFWLQEGAQVLEK